jgi:hypothetical protein
VTGASGVFDLRDGFAGEVNPSHATPAFDTMLEALADAGGGVLYVPPGDWIVSAPVAIVTPGTRLLGAGMRASYIRARAEAPFHTVEVTAGDVSIERVTVVGILDALDDLDPGYHAIRFGAESADWVQIRDVVVEDAHGYGIGLQRASYSYVVIENVVINRTGSDGIDFKNSENDGTRCFLRHMRVERSAVLATQDAGIDVRGNLRIQSVDVLEVGPDRSGVRFRPGDADMPNGLGGDWSSLEGYYITATDSTSHPVDIVAEEGVTVAVGSVEVVDRGTR